MSEALVPIAAAMAAFGVAVTVERPYPDDAAIQTTGIWLSPFATDFPSANDSQRREPRRVIALAFADVPTMPRGTTLTAPEVTGGTVKRWRVDGFERIESDHVRVVVIADPDPTD